MPGKTCVKEVMTTRVISAGPEMEIGAAAHLMGREQVRRLPVLEAGKLCGMVSVGDLAAREDINYEAAEALGEICINLCQK
jgi:CBS domain-containing protein